MDRPTDESRPPHATMAELAVVLSQWRRTTRRALLARTLVGVERDLTEPRSEHSAVYSALPNKVDAVPALRCRPALHPLAATSRKHTKTEAFQQLQARNSGGNELDAGLQGETVAGTARL